ncbi:hypothetical protein IAR50_005378 [Cryptococcus sp. DSM 104548]
MAQPQAPSELEIEIALLGCLGETRPLGRHKHVLIIQLQGAIHRRLGIWLPVGSLWQRLDELYDLDGLDELASEGSKTLPPSPVDLSPRIPLSPPRSSSNSPLSDISSPSQPSPPSRGKTKHPISRSAQVLNSRHFRHVFDLPYFRLRRTPHSDEEQEDEDDDGGKEEEEEEDEEGDEERDSDEESDEDSFEFDLDREEELAWQGIILSRAVAAEGTDEPWGGVAWDGSSSPSEDGEQVGVVRRNGASRTRPTVSASKRRESAVSIPEGKKRRTKDSPTLIEGEEEEEAGNTSKQGRTVRIHF